MRFLTIVRKVCSTAGTPGLANSPKKTMLRPGNHWGTGTVDVACNSSDSPCCMHPCRCFWVTLELPDFSTMLEANIRAHHALVWAKTSLRLVHDSFCHVHWSDASWACRCEGSAQRGHLIGITNTSFLQQAECKITGKQARFARSANAAELQAAACCA